MLKYFEKFGSYCLQIVAILPRFSDSIYEGPKNILYTRVVQKKVFVESCAAKNLICPSRCKNTPAKTFLKSKNI